MAFLEVVTGADGGPFILEKERFVIGRSDGCDLVLSAPTVSREHACIERAGGGFRLADRGSRHGTLLNGSAVTSPVRLSDGDEIAICDAVLRFHAGEAAPAEVSFSDSAGGSMIMSTLTVVSGEAGAEESAGPGDDRVASASKLRAVMDVLRCLRTTLAQDRLLDEVLGILLRLFPHAARGLVLFLDENGELRPVARRRRPGVAAHEEPPVSRTILDQALSQRQAILSADASRDDLFGAARSIVSFGIHSVMCVPLLDKENEPIGIVQVHAEETGKTFSEDDLQVLVSVGSAVSLAIENLRLHEDLVRREKLENELALAREIQARFLHSAYPAVAGYSFHARYRAASVVGGDYYGFIELPGGRIGIAIGDVSGKGMPAAMLMARISSDVRSSLLTESDPGRALGAVERSLREAEIEEKFVTLLFMVLDPAAHTVAIANAGHIPPLLRRAGGEVEEIDGGVAGYPLLVSLEPEPSFGSHTVDLGPGETVLAFTDGVIEAMSPERELFGIASVRELLAAPPGTPRDVVERLERAVADFESGAGQHDDLTLVSFGREGGHD